MSTLVDNGSQGDEAASDAAATALWNELKQDREEPEGTNDDADPPPAEGRDDADDEGAADIPDPPAEEADPPQDPWSSAPAELKTDYEQAIARTRALEHAQSSDRGRISALQRQLDELKKGGAAAQPAAKAPANPLETDAWKRLKEDYPDLADPIEALLVPIVADVTATKSTVAERAEAERLAQETARYTDNERLLSERIKGTYQKDPFELVAQPAFRDWLTSQPAHIQKAAANNGERIEDVEEAADLLSRFIGATTPQTPAATPNNPAPPLAGRRRQQLESATAVSSRSPAAVAGVPEDPEGAWAHFAAERERKKRQGHR